jgi:hypothetical protein
MDGNNGSNLQEIESKVVEDNFESFMHKHDIEK